MKTKTITYLIAIMLIPSSLLSMEYHPRERQERRSLASTISKWGTIGFYTVTPILLQTMITYKSYTSPETTDHPQQFFFCGLASGALAYGAYKLDQWASSQHPNRIDNLSLHEKTLLKMTRNMLCGLSSTMASDAITRLIGMPVPLATIVGGGFNLASSMHSLMISEDLDDAMFAPKQNEQE